MDLNRIVWIVAIMLSAYLITFVVCAAVMSNHEDDGSDHKPYDDSDDDSEDSDE